MHFKYSLISTLLLMLSFYPLTAAAFERALSGTNQLDDFGKQIEMSIESRNPYFFNISFDAQQIIDHVIEKAGTESDTAFNTGLTEGLKSSLDMGTLILDELGANGSFKYITSYTDGDYSWLVFRLLNDNGINYHAYKTEKFENGFRITDEYSFLSGDKLSEIIESMYNRNAIAYLERNIMDQQMVLALEKLDKIKELYAKGKYSKAYQLYQSFPLSVKHSKTFQYVGLKVAEGLDKEKYLKVFNEFIAGYPEQKGKYLIPLDGLVKQGMYAEAIQCIDSLDNALNTDPLLDFFRAKIKYIEGDLENAKLYLAKVINFVPDFEMGYLSLLNIYLTEKNFKEATALLDQMVLTFNTYKEALAPFLTNFPEYLNSSVYMEWIDQ
jgi:hypothetical protein